MPNHQTTNKDEAEITVRKTKNGRYYDLTQAILTKEGIKRLSISQLMGLFAKLRLRFTLTPQCNIWCVFCSNEGSTYTAKHEKHADIDLVIKLCEMLFKKTRGPTTIAGRIIYFSFAEQLIEIQKGVMAHDIGQEREKFPYLNVDLQFFEISDRIEYGHLLLQSGFKKTEVDGIISCLAKYAKGFESLKNISRLPTLEFAYTVERRLVVVDVDWPRQYQGILCQ
ncbi:hypothetical protein KKI19_02935 [Patescibacteria group bacterium]|nr:hypothetical protein [Patescibacteria group bacterium]